MTSPCAPRARRLRSGWLPLLAAALLGCAPEPPALRAGETDVLWLTLCTLRPDRLGVYGHPGGLSPELDRLAESGVVFEESLQEAARGQFVDAEALLRDLRQ